MLLPSQELAILIFNFFSTNLKVTLKTLQIEKFKKHLKTKNSSYYKTTKEIKKYASMSKIRACHKMEIP